MSYSIKNYSYQQAKKLGVEIKPSTNKNKKIDVFKNGEKIASIGAIGYSDFPEYMEKKGLEYAFKRRKLFKARFRNKDKIINSPAYYVSNILW